MAPISFEGASVYIGVICGLGAALFMSLYTLAFKKAFQNVDLLQVALIVSLTHVFACLLFTPVPAISNLTNYEPWHISKMPWGPMLAAWTCALSISIFHSTFVTSLAAEYVNIL